MAHRLLVLVFLITASFSRGQDPFIINLLAGPNTTLRQPAIVRTLYAMNGYQKLWLPNSTKPPATVKWSFPDIAEFGLEPKDYQLPAQPIPGNNAKDSAWFDIRTTDALVHFFYHVAYGNKPLGLRYAGLPINYDIQPVIRAARKFHDSKEFAAVIPTLEPRYPAYKNGRRLLQSFHRLLKENNFKEIIIRSTEVSPANQELVRKLAQLQILPEGVIPGDKELVKKLREAQVLLGVLEDGKLRSTSLAALNIPLKIRAAELKELLNKLRKLQPLYGKNMALLNVPATMLYIYNNDTISLVSKIIAGQPGKPTPTLSSQITEVIVYPYWNVPHSIATRELLPSIRKNPGYLAAHEMQVISRSGAVINPYKINWHALGPGNFPYTIRQSTGCDNALGVLKFNFYNPFTVYLHDTPNKGLFFLSKRFLSHGCMRVEKPGALAGLLLGERITTIESLITKCLRDQKPRTLKMQQPFPIVVLYSTAWFTPDGSIRFYEDVYHRNAN